MRRPLAIALVALAVAVPARPSSAAAPCWLLTDPKGDVGYSDTDHAVARPGEDLLAVDVSATTSTLTALIRLDALPGAGEAATPEPAGTWWYAQMQTADGIVLLSVFERDGTYTFGAGYGHGVGPAARNFDTVDGATGSIDGAHATLRVTLPLSALAPLTSVRPGVRWSPTEVDSFVAASPPSSAPMTQGGVGVGRDHAATDRAIVLGRPTCGR